MSRASAEYPRAAHCTALAFSYARERVKYKKGGRRSAEDMWLKLESHGWQMAQFVERYRVHHGEEGRNA